MDINEWCKNAMSDVLTSKELGDLFEAFIIDSLGYCDEIYNETEIRRMYTTITTIDILARKGNFWFLIQCKYRDDKTPLSEVKAFKIDINDLINELRKLNNNYIFIPIYLTRVINSPNGLEVLLNIAENIYLYPRATIINTYTLASNFKDFMTLLMKVHNYILSKTGISITLKEWNSNEVLMAYLI
jgi:hypothetical protein